MKSALANKVEPIYSAFEKLEKSSYSSSSYRMRGPFPEWGRSPNIRTDETKRDAAAAYENALMWAITGKKAHAKKAMEILNAWSRTLKRVGGRDGVLASGLQGFRFVNAAELLRHTDSGWPEEEAKRCERWFMDVWHPTIEHYAFFANGNWETAALQTKMAIAVYCDDRRLFEETVRYAANGSGNGSIPNMIVYPTGQCQETTRAQHYAQLGIGLLVNAAEVAWNQGVDLYAWRDNRILKGFEYTAKYGLGETVPYQHYLDRTGKYGLGGHHKNYTEISPLSRGSFWPIFERPLNHYTKRRGLAAPYSSRVIEKIRPEGSSHDHIGFGTLMHWRPASKNDSPTSAPGVPAGLFARSSDKGILLTWVRSVEPTSCTDASSYNVYRSKADAAEFKRIASAISSASYEDLDVAKDQLYDYAISAVNASGESPRSALRTASFKLPSAWSSQDIGSVGVAGFAEYNGRTFSMEAEGRSIGGTADSFHFAYARMKGDGAMSARIVLPMSSQWATPGVMMRESLEAGSRHASALLLPHWNGALVTRKKTAGKTTTAEPRPIEEPFVLYKNRLMHPYWVRIVRSRNTFTAYISSDGNAWSEIGSEEIPMAKTLYVGLTGCSQLKGVSTTVTYDHVSIPTFRMNSRP